MNLLCFNVKLYGRGHGMVLIVVVGLCEVMVSCEALSLTSPSLFFLKTIYKYTSATRFKIITYYSYKISTGNFVVFTL